MDLSLSPWESERSKIKCCMNCVPPKRYPGCGAKCEQYKKEKAEYLRNKELKKQHEKKYQVLTEYDFNKIKT